MLLLVLLDDPFDGVLPCLGNAFGDVMDGVIASRQAVVADMVTGDVDRTRCRHIAEDRTTATRDMGSVKLPVLAYRLAVAFMQSRALHMPERLPSIHLRRYQEAADGSIVWL